MKFQGFLLAAIILVSVFLTTPRTSPQKQEAENPQNFISSAQTVSEKNSDVSKSASAVDVIPTQQPTNSSEIGGDIKQTTAVQTQTSQSEISAQIILVKFLNATSTLKAIKIGDRWPIASLTKLMTALIAVENIDLNKEIEISEKAVKQNSGTTGDFKAGEVYKAEDLLKAMLILSSNDAATALAESFGEENFIFLMNQKAVELKMTETKFIDPTGISSSTQSTAEDLSKLVDYIFYQKPEIFNFTKEPIISISEIKSGQQRVYRNINEFAFAGQDNFLGGKTGFIDESKGNLISLFSDPYGRGPILIIILGSDNRFEDTKTLLWSLPK